jgi:hypothetical protein
VSYVQLVANYINMPFPGRIREHLCNKYKVVEVILVILFHRDLLLCGGSLCMLGNKRKILFILDLSKWLVGETGSSISSLATVQIFSSAYSRVYSQLRRMSGMIKLPAILAKNVTTNTLVSICFIFLCNDCVIYLKSHSVWMSDRMLDARWTALCDRVT